MPNTPVGGRRQVVGSPQRLHGNHNRIGGSQSYGNQGGSSRGEGGGNGQVNANQVLNKRVTFDDIRGTPPGGPGVTFEDIRPGGHDKDSNQKPSNDGPTTPKGKTPTTPASAPHPVETAIKPKKPILTTAGVHKATPSLKAKPSSPPASITPAPPAPSAPPSSPPALVTPAPSLPPVVTSPAKVPIVPPITKAPGPAATILPTSLPGTGAITAGALVSPTETPAAAPPPPDAVNKPSGPDPTASQAGIAGGVIGGIVFFFAIGFCLIWITHRRRRARRRFSPDFSTPPESPPLDFLSDPFSPTRSMAATAPLTSNAGRMAVIDNSPLQRNPSRMSNFPRPPGGAAAAVLQQSVDYHSVLSGGSNGDHSVLPVYDEDDHTNLNAEIYQRETPPTYDDSRAEGVAPPPPPLPPPAAQRPAWGWDRYSYPDELDGKEVVPAGSSARSSSNSSHPSSVSSGFGSRLSLSYSIVLNASPTGSDEEEVRRRAMLRALLPSSRSASRRFSSWYSTDTRPKWPRSSSGKGDKSSQHLSTDPRSKWPPSSEEGENPFESGDSWNYTDPGPFAHLFEKGDSSAQHAH